MLEKGEKSQIMNAREVIKAGESAVALFTRGAHFVLHQDGSGYTGNWVIDSNRRVDKIIIYQRDTKDNQHKVYVGEPVEIIESGEKGRRQIKMADVRFVGTTTCNWNDFTETKHGAINPIKYIR